MPHQVSPSPPTRSSKRVQSQPQPCTERQTTGTSPAAQAVETRKQEQEHDNYPESREHLLSAEQTEKPREQQRIGSPGEAPVTRAAATADATKLSWEDIQLVQNLIERCLQLYMSQDEVIHTLSIQAKIKPGFTNLVWQKLEEQNGDFFKAYYARLKLKNQIILFNHLLQQQYQAMHMQMPPMHAGHQPFPIGYPVLPHAHPPLIATGQPSLIPMHGHAAGMTIPAANGPSFQGSPNTKTENVSSMAMDISHPMNDMEGTSFPFNSADMCGIGMSLDGQFSSNDAPCSSGLMGSLNMGSDAENVGAREMSFYQLPRNFSLSDLTADLTHEDLGALGSYSDSPFLSPDETDVYFKSPEKDEVDEEKMIDAIIEPCYQPSEEN